MALTPPMVPTTGQYGFDINDEDIEIGIGIHGELNEYTMKKSIVSLNGY